MLFYHANAKKREKTTIPLVWFLISNRSSEKIILPKKN